MTLELEVVLFSRKEKLQKPKRITTFNKSFQRIQTPNNQARKKLAKNIVSKHKNHFQNFADTEYGKYKFNYRDIIENQSP